MPGEYIYLIGERWRGIQAGIREIQKWMRIIQQTAGVS
jgi:hypothetical protein